MYRLNALLQITLVLTLTGLVPVHADDHEDNTPRLLMLDDIEAVKSIGSPVLSPDGRLAAYTFDDRIHVVPTRGGDARAVTASGASASEPAWSRDGDYLYFLSDRSGSSQLWRLPVEAFGEAEQLTELERGISELEFSPDQSKLLMVMDDDASGDDAEAEVDDDVEANADIATESDTDADNDNFEADAETSKPFVITRLHFKRDAGEGYLTEWPSDHLYTYDLDSETLTQLTDGRYSEGDAAWSPDGDTVVFVSNREEDPDRYYRDDLWLVPAATDDDERPLTRLTNDADVKSSPAFSPDGKLVAYLSAVDGVYGINRLTIVPAAGGEPRILSADLDRSVRDFEFSADGSHIYLTYESHGGRHLARVRVRDGRIERLLEGDRVVSGFDVDARGTVVARVATSNRSHDLYRLQGATLQPLTDVNAAFFASRQLGQQEKVSYTLDDGTVVEAFITLPPDYEAGRRYPAILNIHGGPVAQFTWGYSFRAQWLAAQGYVVIEPNPRGSTGRGQDFVNAIYKTWGITEYPDVIGAADHAIELGYADPDRLFVTGYSYGGYMTNVVITRTDRFKAAASGAGHSLIVANYGHDIYQKWYNWELGPPWANREGYDRLSPFLDVDKVQTPTIFLGGRVDWNVPVLNAELMYQALRYRGIDSTLVVYPDAHHGGWPVHFEKDYIERIAAWFDKYDHAD
ncbi:MAG: S9 family peptidase [Woeseia sp.]